VSFSAAIIDTNVVVAGLLSAGKPLSPVARVPDGMLAAAFPFVLSEALLAEYRQVLLRQRIRALHGLGVREIDDLLTELAALAIVLAPVATSPAPDPGDQLLWELLAARTDLILVTGDERLLRDKSMQTRVMSARTFVEGCWPA